METVQADIPRYWLEEAQHIELSNDPKCEQLNDIVDKIELVYKAYHQCSTGEELELLSKEVEKIIPRLKFERIHQEIKPKLKLGEVANEGFSVVDYL